MQNGTVPMQANFSKLNPKISSLESDHMEIPLLNKSWKGKNVCVNNYGAAGSNAAMIICKAPENQGQQEEQSKLRTPLKKLPLLLSAHSQSSLRAYCAALRHSFANRDRIDDGSRGDIADTAFALAHRSNYSLTTSIATSVNSLSELDALLLEQAESNEPQLPVYSPKKPTTVLCFGGQTKTWIGLSEELFQNILIFRMHLDRCEHICRSLGVKGFYPKVFSKTPIEDMVLLQCMLFSIQYACAKSWIDCALQVDVVIGHSFGQLTALCVSGSISLLQGLQLVKGRATLIKDLCGLEKGKMLSLESDLDTVRKALSMANQNNSQDVEIACFNGPSTHVLVGSKASMEALESKIENETRILGALKARRLDVTHGFHSHLVDPILPGLAELASAIDFHEPRIKVETCSKDRSWTQIDAHSITQHSREPVYFSEAVNRIAKERGPCNWIEAGTDSGITGMVRRALDAPVQTKHSFQPISLTSGNGMDSLTDATVSLWQLGVKVQFWPFHRLQRHRYKRISLPPYQFDKQGHWIEYREPTAIKPTGDQDRTRILNLLSFVSFMRPQNSNQSFAEFIIDPESQAFKTYVQGHKVLGNSSCPASVYIHLISKAVAELLEEDLKKAEGTFCIDQLEMQSPLGLISQRTISLSLESSDHTPGTWSFRICSYDSTETLKVVNHASGVAYLNQAHPHATIPDLQPSSPHTQAGEEASIAGSFIYKIFSTVVEYAEYFKGLQQVSSRGTEVTGLVSLSQISAVLPQIGPDLLCDPLMIDNFLQVAGLYINCLQDNKPGTLYVCTQIQRFQRHLVPGKQQLGPWGVVCHVVSTSAKVIAFDIRASDVQNQSTVVTISGALFTKVSAVSLTRTLSKLRSMKESSSINNDAVSIEDIDDELTKNSLTPEPQNGFEVVAALAEQSVLEKPSFPVKVAQISDNENLCFIRLRELLSSLTEIPVEDMHRKSLLQEIGLDSLMTTEVLGEIEKAFEISITMSEFDKIKDLGCLSSHIESKDPQRFGAVVAPPEPVIKSNVTRSLKESDTLKTPGGDRNTENTAISRDCIDGKEGATAAGEKTSMSSDTAVPSPKVLECFEAAREDFSCVLDETQLTGFTKSVFPGQSKLVEAYVVEAFENLGCSLSQIQEGDSVSVTSVTQYTPLMKQLHQILQRSSLIHCYESGSVRSGAPISEPPAYDILQKLLESFPQHASEHHLLGAMGPHLANFISGKEDPIQLLFGSKATKDLLTDVYSNAPMFATGTRLLANFLLKSIATKILPTKIRILEIGGGVCGTTASIIELLESTGHPFTYTFTDISPSFVAAAKTRFASHGSMEFRVLDIEATPPSFLLRSQDVVIATNVVHATKSLKESCTNIRKMLDKDGMLCLVELTTNLYWFDLVFGLLDGWWRFEDGRKHAIADVEYWERSLHEAEFEQVVWTGDGSEEGDLIRLMVAFAPNEGMKPEQCATEKALMTMETIMFRKVDRIPLYADIYHPHTVQKAKSKRPIGTSSTPKDRFLALFCPLGIKIKS